MVADQFLKPVARAVAEGGAVQRISQEQLAHIRELIATLERQAGVIEGIAALYPPDPETSLSSGNGTASESESSSSSARSSGSGQLEGKRGLTDVQRERIMELSLDLYRRQIQFEPGDILSRLEREGETLEVSNPISTIGSIMYRARQRLGKESKDSQKELPVPIDGQPGDEEVT